MHKGFLRTGALIAALSVLTGAFAAHKIKGLVSDRALEIFETAVRYQFYHAFAILITGIVYAQFPHSRTLWAGRVFIIGIGLFSGSLYFLAYLHATVSPSFKWAGAITPFGGAAFIAGWIFLALAFFKAEKVAY